VALRAVEAALAKFPPVPDPLSPGRRGALEALDAVLQEPEAGHSPAVQEFFHRRIEGALVQMDHADARPGATVWHIYNQGFVVRTPSATLCFDLVRVKYLRGFALSETTMRRIVNACDALFVSHVHADHAETFVAQTFIDQGKPVVAPEQIGYRKPLFDKVTHLEESADKVHLLQVRGGRITLKVVVFPGHQGGEIDNNVVLITSPEGISIAHTGDQWHVPDFDWIDRVHRRHRVDILLVNDWTYDIARLVKGFAPAVVVPGHANELGHPVAKRQPYLLSLQRKAGSSRFGGGENVGYSHPLVVMAWGEAYRYERPEDRRR
jgi:L-ascorbate metabolism protein UlaG (beta-lactamase superfamily)